jgi:NhaP-type Na+/H+ or K+/H+ antiporter
MIRATLVVKSLDFIWQMLLGICVGALTALMFAWFSSVISQKCGNNRHTLTCATGYFHIATNRFSLPSDHSKQYNLFFIMP